MVLNYNILNTFCKLKLYFKIPFGYKIYIKTGITIINDKLLKKSNKNLILKIIKTNHSKFNNEFKHSKEEESRLYAKRRKNNSNINSNSDSNTNFDIKPSLYRIDNLKERLITLNILNKNIIIDSKNKIIYLKHNYNLILNNINFNKEEKVFLDNLLNNKYKLLYSNKSEDIILRKILKLKK